MKKCCKCDKPATLKEGREVYCGQHYMAVVMGVSTTSINGKPIYVAAKAA